MIRERCLQSQTVQRRWSIRRVNLFTSPEAWIVESAEGVVVSQSERLVARSLRAAYLISAGSWKRTTTAQQWLGVTGVHTRYYYTFAVDAVERIVQYMSCGTLYFRASDGRHIYEDDVELEWI